MEWEADLLCAAGNIAQRRHRGRQNKIIIDRRRRHGGIKSLSERKDGPEWISSRRLRCLAYLPSASYHHREIWWKKNGIGKRPVGINAAHALPLLLRFRCTRRREWWKMKKWAEKKNKCWRRRKDNVILKAIVKVNEMKKAGDSLPYLS